MKKDMNDLKKLVLETYQNGGLSHNIIQKHQGLFEDMDSGLTTKESTESNPSYVPLVIDSKKSFEEVGGFFPDRLGISFVGVCAREGMSGPGEMMSFYEEDLPKLFPLIEKVKALNEDFILDKKLQFVCETTMDLSFRINSELCFVLIDKKINIFLL
jgi:hypothetical protein